VQLAYSPENLRLRAAIERFRNPDRVVLGIRDPSARSRLAELFAPFSQALEWMSVESAEMAKHAVNAFLATSISFTNELASLCEVVGADARDVERALRSELRIGRQAYVSAGAAFAGGTLARDVRFLTRLGDDTEIPALLFHAVSASNDAHKDWPRRKLRELLPTIKDAHIAVLGLTYKPGTDTLRRSASLELCGWLLERGAHVLAYDPAVRELPLQLSAVRMCTSPEDALAGADAAALATEWPMFRSLTAETFVGTMRNAVVGDPNRFLGADVQDDDRICYAAVGVPARAL
jgi:UDPglucose 6-dehydrogenase